jgi:hypothetical protein
LGGKRKQIIGDQQECVDCKSWKPLDDYYTFSRSRSGYGYICKTCISHRRMSDYYSGIEKAQLRARNYAKTLPGITSLLKRKHAISDEEARWWAERTQGVCDICSQTCRIKSRLSVDHCHTTLKIRGVLCDDCNMMLGRAKDDVSILLSAIRYLSERSSDV